MWIPEWLVYLAVGLIVLSALGRIFLAAIDAPMSKKDLKRMDDRIDEVMGSARRSPRFRGVDETRVPAAEERNR